MNSDGKGLLKGDAVESTISNTVNAIEHLYKLYANFHGATSSSRLKAANIVKAACFLKLGPEGHDAVGVAEQQAVGAQLK
jgi:hypothetical protein